MAWLNIKIAFFKIFISSSYFYEEIPAKWMWRHCIKDVMHLKCTLFDYLLYFLIQFYHNTFIITTNGSECFSRWPPNSIDFNGNGTDKYIFKHFPVVGLHQISKWSQSTVWDIIRLIGRWESLFFHSQFDITVELAIKLTESEKLRIDCVRREVKTERDHGNNCSHDCCGPALSCTVYTENIFFLIWLSTP